MRRANVQLQSDRRAEILAAAERCFVKSGFHQASMHEICVEAGMSPGNLYRYFPSKEAIIAGIAERNRAEAAESFGVVEQAPDFFTGLAAVARHHLVESTADEVALCAEIMAESRRNPEVHRLFQDIDRDIKARLAGMLRRAAERGEISRELDFEGAAVVLMAIGDGISWRRTVDPTFQAEAVLPLILGMIHGLLTRPVEQTARSPGRFPHSELSTKDATRPGDGPNPAVASSPSGRPKAGPGGDSRAT